MRGLLRAFFRPQEDRLRKGELHFRQSHGSLLDATKLEIRIPKEAPAIYDGTPLIHKILKRDITVHACPECKSPQETTRTKQSLVYKHHPHPKSGRSCRGSGALARGAIELITIPVFGKQGYGKSKMVNALIEVIVQKHGKDNVHCVISNDFRALQANIDPTKNVQVLFLDDALDSAFSRGGTPAALRDAIKHFFKMRHRLEKAMRILHNEEVDVEADTMDNMHYPGLIYFFMGTQSFKGTEKQFRTGITIFKSPLEEDNEEITRYWASCVGDAGIRGRQCTAAWGLLFDIQRKRLEENDPTVLTQSIVVVPSRGPLILKAPMVQTEYFEAPYGRRVVWEEKTELGELAEHDRRVQHIARLFLQKHDPDGKNVLSILRDFVRQFLIQLSEGEVVDDVIKVSDAPELIASKTIRDILDRARALKLQAAHQEEGQGEQTLATGEDAIVKKVSEEWVKSGGNPMEKANGVASAMLYSFITREYAHMPEFRKEAEKLRQKIMWAATAIFVEVEDGTRPHPAAAARKGDLEREEVAPDVAPPLSEVIQSPQFTFDVAQEVNRLPEYMARLARRKGKNAQAERGQWTKMVRAWRKRRVENMPREELALVSKEELGSQTTGRNIDYWVTKVESAAGVLMGEAYERWWERMIADGWRHKGLRDARISSVKRGGGSGHEPDVTVTYEDGGMDFWSLKCFSAKEYVTLVLWNEEYKKRSDFKPEVQAFRQAHQAWVAAGCVGAGPRLGVVFREVLVPGAEFFAVFTDPKQLVQSGGVNVTFSRKMIGQPNAVVWRNEAVEAKSAEASAEA